MSLFVSCYKTFVTTLWPPMPQPQQTPYPLQILTLLPSFFTPADLKSKPQTTRNYQTEWGKKKKKNVNIPLNPQNHRYLLLSKHNINIFSLSTSCSSSPCFLSAIKIAHQINQETPKKKTTKTKVRYKEKRKRKKDAEFFILGFRGSKFSAEDSNARPGTCDDAVATTSELQTDKTPATQEKTQNTKQIRSSFTRSLRPSLSQTSPRSETPFWKHLDEWMKIIPIQLTT
jgi:hypothetical protein